MSESIQVYISGIKPEVLITLQRKYNNLNITYTKEHGSMYIKIPKSLEEDFLLNTLNNFSNDFNTSRIYELKPFWFFDEKNSLIKSPDKYFVLTKREVIFLKMLTSSDKLVTYEDMAKNLSEKQEDITLNAIRLFTKNLKKKLPANVLKNIRNTGYKLF
ncbi:MAG: helix-turn-helix domain-containing protein [Campylobacteraceae bacterium]|nr:helix-turn-helix domain-containing protein [Campylobacteraceae bacterium]